MTRLSALALFLAACTPAHVVCQFACVLPGQAVTAGHCASRPEPVVLVPVSSCADAPTRRAPVPGEVATIGERQTTIVDRWLTWLVLADPCTPGESGSGVYGADGALLGVVVENHSGQCYADILL
jgi:hypothetical protein